MHPKRSSTPSWVFSGGEKFCGLTALWRLHQRLSNQWEFGRTRPHQPTNSLILWRTSNKNVPTALMENSSWGLLLCYKPFDCIHLESLSSYRSKCRGSISDRFRRHIRRLNNYWSYHCGATCVTNVPSHSLNWETHVSILLLYDGDGYLINWKDRSAETQLWATNRTSGLMFLQNPGSHSLMCEHYQ